jgi:hypothetical protein
MEIKNPQIKIRVVIISVMVNPITVEVVTAAAVEAIKNIKETP